MGKWMVLAVWGMAMGCSDDSETNAQQKEELANSLEAWDAFRDAHGGDYRYTSVLATWTGHLETTTLDVTDNVVVARAWEDVDSEGTVAMYSEDAASLGAHPRGAAPLTIDEIYDRCASEILTQDPSENSFYLAFADDGVLAHCSYVPKGCVDGCDPGYDITSLEAL